MSQVADREIVGLTADSRQVRPGYLFAALPSSVAGGALDGADFVADAVRRGAAAVLGPPGLQAALKSSIDVPVIEDREPRRRLALLAARFFAAQPETIAAVTGTSGKSSVVDFTRQIWMALGRNGASLGTLGVISAAGEQKLAHTTPDPVVLHRALAELAELGIDHLALEASSHGLEQRRLDGVTVRAAAFTNLSRDHLDYHADEEHYLAAKLRLFDSVMARGGRAVLPAGGALAGRLAAACQERGHHILTFGDAGDVHVRQRKVRPDGQQLTISARGREGSHEALIDLPMIGAFQAENVLCAIALVMACGETPDAVLGAAANLTGVPGRLQAVGGGIYVDYAHKPEALRAAITALRPHAGGRLIVVFGCGGDRDRGKRPQMGRIAAELADRVVVTDDNPRGEEPGSIRGEVLVGCPDAVEIGDRAEAIATAIHWLGAGDILLIAGKGHETGQDIAGIVHPFDDVAVATEVWRGMSA
ncbi:MAG: UDP-N-acetylmuramoyl-L-alanyl-D-glutamate--2,6-diaminopimelate ligase [Alphaproteobacteria bacterium]